MVADYYGVDKPACDGLHDRHVPGTASNVGPRARALVSANMQGDAWRECHDAIKLHLADAARFCRVNARVELTGLFSHVWAAHESVDAYRAVPQRARQGSVPDLGFAADGEEEAIYDVKQITECPSRYPRCARGGDRRAPGECPCARCRGVLDPGHMTAVDRRALSVDSDARRSLRKVDALLVGTPPGAVGPAEQRLIDIGPVRGLVVGAYGEVSKDLERLLLHFADVAARELWQARGCRSAAHAKGIFARRLQTEACFAFARARSRRLQNRLAWITGGERGAAQGRRHIRRAEEWRRAARARARGWRGTMGIG